MNIRHILSGCLLISLLDITFGALIDTSEPDNDPQPEPEPHERGLIRDKLVAGLSKIFGKFGILECNGLEGLHRRDSFLQAIFKDRPTLGNFMCGPTCGGHCVPYSSFAEAPTSLSYAFGCQCPAQRCSPGPIVDHLADPSFKVVCTRDDSCSCSGIGGPLISHRGYLCNWIRMGEEASNPSAVTYDEVGMPDGFFSTHSRKGLTIKWCACCPSHRN